MFRHCNFEEAYEDLMHEARKAQRDGELEQMDVQNAQDRRGG